MKPGNLIQLKELNPEWEEIDTMMLFACFTLLEKFIVEEMHLTDWQLTPNTKLAKQEIDDLYTWWKVRKDNFLKGEEIEQQEVEDTEMLKRLIDIRFYLWS